jgi:hypothetical protein
MPRRWDGLFHGLYGGSRSTSALAIQRRATAAAPQALEAQNRALREENEALTRAAAERAPTTLNVRVAWRPDKQAASALTASLLWRAERAR